MEPFETTDEFLESTTSRGPKRQLAKVNSIIIHTTGYGAGLERIKNLNKTLEEIGFAYAHRMANILKYKGHFLIDHTGKIWQFLPLTEVAWHTGSSKRKVLATEELYSWWRNRWQGTVKRPTELAVWEGSPNGNSIGIDLLAHGNGAITSGYTEKQYISLANLIKSLSKTASIPLERKYILGHEDVDPISRGSKKGGWDPGKFDWDQLFLLMRDDQQEVEESEEIEEIAEVVAKNFGTQLWLFLKGFLRGV